MRHSERALPSADRPLPSQGRNALAVWARARGRLRRAAAKLVGGARDRAAALPRAERARQGVCALATLTFAPIAARSPSVRPPISAAPRSRAFDCLRSPAIAFDCLRSPAIASDCLRLPPIACDCLRLPSTASDRLRLPSTASDRLRLPPTAFDCLRSPAIASDCLRLRSLAPSVPRPGAALRRALGARAFVPRGARRVDGAQVSADRPGVAGGRTATELHPRRWRRRWRSRRRRRARWWRWPRICRRRREGRLGDGARRDS